MEELKGCPSCGSGLARGPWRYTNASFSGVELVDYDGAPYVWCGNCGEMGRRCETTDEATKAWNNRQ